MLVDTNIISYFYRRDTRAANAAQRIKLRHGCPGSACRAERKLVNTNNDGAQKGGADVACSAWLDHDV